MPKDAIRGPPLKPAFASDEVGDTSPEFQSKLLRVLEDRDCEPRLVAVVLATGDVIRPEHLALGPTPSESPARLPTLEDLEREHVARVLAVTGGHKARAAQILGVIGRHSHFTLSGPIFAEQWEPRVRSTYCCLRPYPPRSGGYPHPPPPIAG